MMDYVTKAELADALRAMADMIEGANGAPRRASGGAVADDRELESEHGNGVVKFSPRRWLENGGEDCKGRQWSECPSQFLDAYAEALEYSAAHPKAGKEKFAEYDARDARRVRGWSRRNAGKRTESAPTRVPFSAGASDDSDGIPF